MKPSGIGGMAVMEGVMMKNKEEYAVAVRKPNNEIAVEKSTHKDFSDKVKLFKLPIFRGMLAFVDSMVIGVKVLNYSASFFEEEEEETLNKKKNGKSEKKKNKKADNDNADFEIEEVSVTHKSTESFDKKESKEAKEEDKSNALLMAFAVLISIVISVALFMVLPVLLTNLLSNLIDNKVVMNLIEGLVRLAIFIGYVLLASRMSEIKRVFMYHGAEHKTINCLEHGCELTVENVRKHSKQHKRCGTSFMLLVILISLIFFLFVPTGNLIWKILSRVLLVPFIAGVSYEFIRLAGKSENKVVDALSKPGLWMQGLTTKEPDDTMIEVAIASVDAVFDWRAFLANAKEDDKADAGKKSVSTAEIVKGNKPVKADRQDKIEKQSKEEKQDRTEKQSKEEKQDKTEKQSKEEKQDKTEKQSQEEKQDRTEKQPKEEKQDRSDKQSKTVTQSKTETLDKAEKQTKTEKHKDNVKSLEHGKQANAAKHETQIKSNTLNRTHSTPVSGRPSKDEEEDDEILKALDKFFDNGANETKKAAKGK